MIISINHPYSTDWVAEKRIQIKQIKNRKIIEISTNGTNTQPAHTINTEIPTNAVVNTKLVATIRIVIKRVPLTCGNAGWLGKATNNINKKGVITIVNPSVTEGRRKERTLTEGIQVVKVEKAKNKY